MRRLCLLMVFVLGMLATIVPEVCGQTEDEADTTSARFDYRRWHYKVKGNKFVQTVSARVTINNRRGAGYGEVSLSTDLFSKLKKFEARRLDVTGRVIFTRDKDDLNKTCGGKYMNHYTDNCIYTTTLASNKYPYVVEWEYSIETQSLFFLRGARFQLPVPVHEATYTLDIPADQPFQYRMEGLETEPTVTADGKRSVYTWQAEQIPASSWVKSAPSGANGSAGLRVVMGEFALGKYDFNGLDWQNIGRWYNELASERYDEGVEVEEHSSGSLLSTAQSVYEEVIADVRYVAVEVGVGGWRPYKASTTAKRGWGDCKDMSTLLISRLRGHGIYAMPALVLTRNRGRITREFPSFGFNHAIAAAIIEGDTIWMDPTCDVCAFGDIPRTDEGIDVLLMSDSGGTIVRTPFSTPRDNTVVRKTRWIVRNDGFATFESSLTAYGNPGVDYRYRLTSASADEQRQLVEQQFRGIGRTLTPDEYTVDIPDVLDQPVTLTLTGHTKSRLDRADLTTYVPAFWLTERFSFETLRLDDRTMPIDLGYPRKLIDSVEIVVDTSIVACDIVLPEPDSVVTSFGHFHFSTASTDSLSVLVLEKEYTSDRIQADQLEAFDLFLDDFTDVKTRLVPLVISR